MPGRRGNTPSACGDILLACHAGVLVYIRGRGASPKRLDCDHMALRCENGTAVMTLRNVLLCPQCTLAGGSSFVGAGSMFFSAANKDGAQFVPARQEHWVPTFKHATEPAVKPSPQQAALLDRDASICRDPNALDDMRAVWEDENTAVLTGTLRPNGNAVNALGLRLRLTLSSWAHTQLGVRIWAQQPVSAFSAVCFGAAIVGGPTGERTHLPGFCTHAANTTLAAIDDASAMQLEIILVGLKLTLCPTCSLVGLGPRGSFFRLSYSGNATLDQASLVMHAPSCVFAVSSAQAAQAVALPETMLASSSQPQPHSSACGAVDTCSTSSLMSGLQLLQSTHGNASVMELLQPSSSPQPARAVFVSGTIIQTDVSAQCLNGVDIDIAFNRRVMNGTASHIAPPEAFNVKCLGLGVAGLERNQTDIGRQCDDVLYARMTTTGVVLRFKDVKLCGQSCWLVGFGASGSFVRITAASGLPIDTAGMRIKAPSCAAGI